MIVIMIILMAITIRVARIITTNRINNHNNRSGDMAGPASRRKTPAGQANQFRQMQD